MRVMKIILKRLTHRTDEKKTAERYIMNTIYQHEYNHETKTLYPLPECIEQNCSMPNCQRPAICMDEYFRIYCGLCISNQFPEQKMVQEKVLIVPSVTQNVLGNAFEWQIQGKNDSWYKIRGCNIKYDSTQRLSTIEIKKRWEELMVEVLEDNPELCEAEYDKETKILTIFL